MMRCSTRFVANALGFGLVLACACGSSGTPAGDPGAEPGDVVRDDGPGDLAGETLVDTVGDVGPDVAVEIHDVVTPPDTGDDVTPPVDAPDAPADVPTDPAADTAVDTVDPDGVLDVTVDTPIDTPPEIVEKPKMAVNEVVSSPPDPDPDWVELINYGTKSVDISGWMLKDNLDTHVFTFPAGTVVAAGQFVVIEGKGGTAPLTANFGYAKADSARLFDASGAPVDETSWIDGQAPLDSSWGRHPDGTGAFATLAQPTRGAANAAP